jgi:hypothetical protein
MLWCIVNDRGEYWSNVWGWGSKKGCFICVTHQNYDLPIGGKWRRYR